MRLEFVLVVVSALLFCWSGAATPPHPTDKQEMINLLQASSNWPSEFNIANIDNMCSWANNTVSSHIRCNADGHITEFHYGPRDPGNLPLLSGSIPASFWNLQSLEDFSLPRLSLLSGTVPSSLFLLPNITKIEIWGSAQTIILPQTLSPRMRDLRIGGVQVIGKMEETWNSTTLTRIEFEEVNVTCPLPQWFVNQVINSGFPFGCQLTESALEIHNNAVCGQIPIEQLNCRMLPTASTLPVQLAKAAGANFPTIYQHRFGNDFVEVHLNGSTVYIFGAVKTPRGHRYVYYDEWVGIEFQGWQERNLDAAKAGILAARWGANLRETVAGKNYTTELIMSDGTVMNMYFYLEHPLAEKGVKFSFDMQKPSSFNHTGLPEFGLAMNPIVRQHLSDQKPLVCTGSASFLSSFRCSSDIANLTIQPDLASGCAAGRVTFESQRLRSVVSLQSCYYTDNNPLTKFLNDLDISPFYPGSGFLRSFSRRYHLDPALASFGTISPEDQYVVAPFSVGFVAFKNISWDPDVRIELLFTPPDSDTPGDISASDDSTAIVAAAVGSVVGVAAIVGVVFLTDLKYKWLPFRRRSEEIAQSPPENIDEEQDASGKANSWSHGSRTRASLTNV